MGCILQIVKSKNLLPRRSTSDTFEFLSEIQKVSSQINRFESELTSITADASKLEKTPNATEFASDSWQLRGHHRFATAQVEQLRALIEDALKSYSCPERRTATLAAIRKQTERAAQAMRELRLAWRDLSGTYHFMLGILDVLA
jgi:hypothetical protein